MLVALKQQQITIDYLFLHMILFDLIVCICYFIVAGQTKGNTHTQREEHKQF